MRLPAITIAVACLSLLAAAGAAMAVDLNGTNGPDTLVGTSGVDRISGKGGNDRIAGLAGNDVLVGGSGLDRVEGGVGDDLLQVRDGERDVTTCGPGRDKVVADQRDHARPDCEVVLRKFTRPPVGSQPPPSSNPEPPPPPAPTETEVTPGSYKGETSLGNYVFFDIAPDRTVRNFKVNDFRRRCDGPYTIFGGLNVGDSGWPIAADGTFLIEYRVAGTIGTSPPSQSTFHVRVTGSVARSSASGTAFVMDEFDYNGRHWVCQTELQTWTATLLQ